MPTFPKMTPASLRALACLLAVVTVAAQPFSPRRTGAWAGYPYASPPFTVFVRDSYDVRGSGDAREFYQWMEKASHRSSLSIWGARGRSIAQALSSARKDISRAKSLDSKSRMALDLCQRLHTMVKRAIPYFSFERGFEFTSVGELGERQCLLQSVLIASMLQSAGVDAGVIMVFRSNHGIESNNGHVVTLVRLPDGNQVLVDASEREPFAVHPGLFVETASRAGRQYVLTTFTPGSPNVLSYTALNGGTRVKLSAVRPLSPDFIRSQFFFYRGEQVPLGLLAMQRTSYGMTLSEQLLRKSITLCPSNALALYSLGKLHYWQGRSNDAVGELTQAKELYSRAGWVPAGCTDFLALATNSAK